MAANRKALESFLLKRCPDFRLAMRIMAGLQPYFDAAETRRFRLEPIGETLSRRAAAVLTQFAGRPGPAVSLVSLTRPFKRRPGMSDADYAAARAGLWPCAGGLIAAKPADILDGFETEIAADLGQERWNEVWETLDAALWFDLWETIRWSLEIDTENGVSSGVWKTLHGSLACFIGASLQPGPVSPGRLRPFVELLPAALPLGLLKDGYGSWLALCA